MFAKRPHTLRSLFFHPFTANSDTDNELRKATRGLTHITVKDVDTPLSVTAGEPFAVSYRTVINFFFKNISIYAETKVFFM